MNVYLDDTRKGPHLVVEWPSDEAVRPWTDWDNWVIVRSVENAKTLLKLGLVENLSLDHDMGADKPEGYDLVKWMVEENCWPTGIITIHSQNPVGARNMKEMIDRYRPATE